MYALQTSALHLPATKMELTAPKRYGILHVRISKSIKLSPELENSTFYKVNSNAARQSL